MSHSPPSSDADPVPNVGLRSTLFGKQVSEALRRLNDLPALQMHSLAQRMAPLQGAVGSPRGEALQARLLGAIEQLQPSPDAPADSRAWTRYNLLRLRYVEEKQTKEIAATLGVAESHYHRLHGPALEAVISLLQAELEPAASPPAAPAAWPTGRGTAEAPEDARPAMPAAPQEARVEAPLPAAPQEASPDAQVAPNEAPFAAPSARDTETGEGIPPAAGEAPDNAFGDDRHGPRLSPLRPAPNATAGAKAAPPPTTDKSETPVPAGFAGRAPSPTPPSGPADAAVNLRFASLQALFGGLRLNRLLVPAATIIAAAALMMAWQPWGQGPTSPHAAPAGAGLGVDGGGETVQGPTPPQAAPAGAGLPAAEAGNPAPAGMACEQRSTAVPPAAGQFLRTEGVTQFTAGNTQSGMLSDRVRSLAVGPRGVWIGYFAADAQHAGGIGLYNKQAWLVCTRPGVTSGMNINALALDGAGNLWAGAESDGVWKYDGQRWEAFSTRTGLPSNQIYSITVDPQNAVWFGSWEGVIKFDGARWTVPYTAENGALVSNHVHGIAFTQDHDIWVGHLDRGVSHYSAAENRWSAITTNNSPLGSNNVRGIVVRPAGANEPESVWIGAAGGGVARVEQGQWTVYRTDSGLPSDEVRSLALDPQRRIWAATAVGAAYWESGRWVRYHSLDTFSVTFGQPCDGCPYDADHVLSGTPGGGLTHSRIPWPNNEEAVHIAKMEIPLTVQPGEQFVPKITVVPRAPHQLREDRGDFLSFVGADEANRLSAFPLLKAKGTTEPGQPFTFADFDVPMTAPTLGDGEQERRIVSEWRIWAHTRYTGPLIRLTVTVRRP